MVDPERKRPYDVRVWNDADESRAVGVRVEADDGPALDREWTVPADGFLAVRLVEPADYSVAVSVEGATVTEFDVAREDFDCATPTTTVQVTPDGDARRAQSAFAVACGPTVYRESFEVTDSGCGSANDASVAFREGGVTIEGRLAVPSPCHGVELAEAALDGGTLRVVVAATDPEGDGGCVQCLGEVAYEAVFAGGPPARVVVVHERGDERAEVTSATCGDCTGGMTTSPMRTTGSDGGSRPSGTPTTTEPASRDAATADAETTTER